MKLTNRRKEDIQMKKFISIIAMFILSVTLLSVTVQAEVDKAELIEALELSDLTPVETTRLYEYDIIEAVENSMEDYEVVLVNSDTYEEVYIYVLVPKNNHLLYIAEDAYMGDIESIQFWDEFTGMLSESSVFIHNHASQVSKNKYAVMILNPENYENLLWMAFDGEIAYDYVNETDNADVIDVLFN